VYSFIWRAVARRCGDLKKLSMSQLVGNDKVGDDGSWDSISSWLFGDFSTPAGRLHAKLIGVPDVRPSTTKIRAAGR
jgi:hypothetical protein